MFSARQPRLPCGCNRCWEQMLLVFPFQFVLGFCAWLYMDPVHGINKFKIDLSDA